MRICATSDIHGSLPDIPKCDVLLIAGDVGPEIEDNPKAVIEWWVHEFGQWVHDLTERGIKVIGIAGNHDFIMQDRPDLAEKINNIIPWTYLQDSGCEYKGVKFWGTPWQPYFGGWAFNAPPEDIIGGGEEFLDEKFRHIPDGIDVLIAHGPPLGIRDRVGGRHCGSEALSRHIERVKPKLAVFGHIHWGYGAEMVDGVMLANVSYVTPAFDAEKASNDPMLFEI